MMVSTNETFLDVLKAAQILSAEELKRAAHLIEGQDDSKAAARKLVAANLITRWQAGQLLKGKATLLLGKYVLIERLPWGSAHAVFLAKHPMMERKVALNVLDKSSSARSEAVKGFLADARAIATLDHRHLIHVYDVDEADNRYFLVMEHVEGRNLHDAVKADGPMSIEVAADVVRQIADGLDHAHRSRLVHGGLRPTNVLLDPLGTVKILDLGVSKLDDPTRPPENGEIDSQVLEIANFLSPEQAAGGAATPQSDLYSLGCLGFMLLTGEPPFGQGDYAQRLANHQRQAVPDVRTHRKDAPAGLAELLQKLMAKTPSERFDSAEDVVTALEKWWSEYAAQLEATKAKPKVVAKPPAPKPAGAAPSAAAKPAPVAAPKPSPVKSTAPKPAPAAKPVASADADSSDSEEFTGFPNINLGPAKKSSRPGTAARSKPSPAPAITTSAEDADTVASPMVTTGKTKSSPPALPLKKAAPTRNAPAISNSDSVETIAATASPAKPGRGAKSRSMLPIVLVAVGGGVLLLLLIGGGLAAYFAFTKGEPAPVAIAPVDEEEGGEEETATDDETSGSDDAEETTDDEEENPTPPDDEPTGEEGGEEKPPVVPTDPPVTDPPVVDPVPPTDPPVVDPPPVDPPPVDPPTAEPPPTDPPPQEPPKEKPANPFAALTPEVSLPPVKEEQASPQVLGAVVLAADTDYYIELLGGDNATAKEKLRFSMGLADGGAAVRNWEVKLEGSPKGDGVVAKLALNETGLTFQWTAEAVKNDDAGYLANCQLKLNTTDHEHVVKLRQPQEVGALPVVLTRPQHREKLEIEYTANPESIVVEILKVEGVEKIEFEPKQQLAAKKDSTLIWFGEGEDRLLGLKIDTLMQKDLQIAVTPIVNDPSGPVKLVAKEVAAGKSSMIVAIQQLGALLQKFNSSSQKAQLTKQITQTEIQLEAAKNSLVWFEKLEKQFEAINGRASVQFRVFSTDGAQQVDLIRGAQAPSEDNAGAK